ncbi:MAG TPA: hypothetical protein VJR89_36730 [Polyangiales bacterium]|nr:hypothetical protein [Polyangiales bacterium]
MTTLVELFTLPYALRGLLGREGVPPRSSGPALPCRPSEPHAPPPAARSGSWEWCVACDSSTHPCLTVAAVYAGRIG